VTELIMERLPVTLRLNLLAIAITYLLAIPLGIYSAIRPDTKSDRLITIFLFFLYSLPVFWVALMLQAGVCVGGYWPIFPLKGIAPVDITGLSTPQIVLNEIMCYVLPVTCLSYAGFAGLSRYTRSGMIEVIGQDYIRTARAKGVPELLVIFKHALRNAMIILVTLFAGLLPGLVAGSIIVEYVFSIPGMGDLSMLALSSRDYPLLMALFGFGGALTLAGIMLSDVLYVAVDPRITFAQKR
ncbi:MAG: ABC transporter permease, partial [Victivallales bacterium]|nr:ABC transporter permease [Victivallales bacterium]